MHTLSVVVRGAGPRLTPGGGAWALPRLGAAGPCRVAAWSSILAYEIYFIFFVSAYRHTAGLRLGEPRPRGSGTCSRVGTYNCSSHVCADLGLAKERRAQSNSHAVAQIQS